MGEEARFLEKPRDIIANVSKQHQQMPILLPGKLKIGFVMSGWDFMNGCVHFRNIVPAIALAKAGNRVEFIMLTNSISPDNFKDLDIVVFSRAYPPQIAQVLDLVKKMKKKIMWESDDDLETLDESNPSKGPIDRMFSGVKMMGWEADGIMTTTPVLRDILRNRYPNKGRNYFVCPNSLDLERYKPRLQHEDLVIGWTGGCTHSVDLLLILDVLIELNKKHDFTFVHQGFTLGALEGQEFVWRKTIELTGQRNEQYYYIMRSLEMCDKFKQLKKFKHIPFYPSEMVPLILGRESFDIGLAPLLDTPFNSAKSNIKYYEYAAIDTLTLASNVVPYNTELTYTVDNNPKAWQDSLTRSIEDKDFRDRLLEEQKTFVIENRDISKNVIIWENALREVMES